MEAQLIGRDRELAELEASLGEALGGRGQLCLLAGESGIGKTYLADRLAQRAAAAGAEVHWGRAWEAGGAPAFWPWVQILRSLTSQSGIDRLSGELGAAAPWLAQILPELRDALPDLETPGSINTDQARFMLFDSITTFLRNVARDRPCAILLDDLHAADPASLLMLEFLARSLRDVPMLVLAAYQEEAAHERPEVEEVIAELGREGRRIGLRPLGEDDLGRLFELHGSALPSPELLRELHATTEGNPFFAREVVRLLAVEGRLELRAPGTSVPFPLPESVRDTVRRRCQPLGADAVELLSLAAVIGREFGMSTLERASRAARESAIEMLDAAVSAGLLGTLPGAPGQFRFAHGLVRETLYGDLTAVQRIRAHQLVGEALEELYAGRAEPHLAELAHHYLEAAPGGNAERAVDYATRAGVRAMEFLAYEEAERLFEGALSALELTGTEPQRRAELLLALGHAQVRSGNPDARTTLLAGAAAARALDRPDLLGRAALGFRAFARLPGVVDEEVVTLLEEALDGLDTSDSVLRARLLVRLAVQLFDHRHAGERRARLVEEAIAMARRLDDPGALAYVLTNAQLAVWGPDTREEALAWSDEVLRLANQIGDRSVMLTVRSRKVDLMLELDDIVGVDREMEALAQLVGESPEPRARAHLALQRARRAMMDARFDDGAALTAEAAALGTRAGDTAIYTIAVGQDWMYHWGRGTLPDLESTARQVAAKATGLRVWRAALAAILCHAGRTEEARAVFEGLAENEFGNFARNDNWLTSMAVLAEVSAQLRDVARARLIYDLMSPFDGRNVISLHGQYMGPVARYLGVTATTFGDLDGAAAHLDAAKASATRAGARILGPILRIDEARLAMARAGDADYARASELLEDAERLAVELGADGQAEFARSMLRERGTEGTPDPAPAPEPETTATATMQSEGDVWVIDYEGRSVRVRDSKGLRYLARLLSSPGVEIHALDLFGAAAVRGVSRGAALDAGIEARPGGDGGTGPALDAEAKAAYRARLEELQGELEEAESFNDPERAARAREELEFVANELSGAMGLGGRDRESGSNAERARVNATRSIRGVMKRIAGYDAALGRELEATVRTGTFCAYEPDPRRPVSWTVDAG
jgi:AAA ATPase-like protein